MKKYEDASIALSKLWDQELSRIREGKYTSEDGEVIKAVLLNINIEDDEFLPKEIVTLLWFIPQFMEWQIERVQERTPLGQDYRNLCLWVSDRMGEILGNP